MSGVMPTCPSRTAVAFHNSDHLVRGVVAGVGDEIGNDQNFFRVGLLKTSVLTE